MLKIKVFFYYRLIFLGIKILDNCTIKKKPIEIFMFIITIMVIQTLINDQP
jgi:hypothetical protein